MTDCPERPTPPAPKPPDEAARLAALDALDVLHTGPERAFDELARRASRLCGTPISMVSLVGEAEQWWKARIGVPSEGTPREHAFCAYCILEPDELLVVPDATADPRFRDSPLVTGEPGIRFYAGAPLVTSDGHAVGALCVIDRAPRTLGEDDAAALRALARDAVALLEARRARHHEERRRDRHVGPADSADAHRATARLDGIAHVDAGTGLYDRHALMRRLREEVARCDRSRLPLALLLIHVARLDAGTAPDRLAGDDALVMGATRLVADLRAEDAAFRLAGDTFAVLLPFTGHDDALVVAERLRRRLGAQTAHGALVVSVGLAAHSTAIPDGPALLAAAGRALEAARHGGRDRVIGYHVQGTPPPRAPARPPLGHRP